MGSLRERERERGVCVYIYIYIYGNDIGFGVDGFGISDLRHMRNIRPFLKLTTSNCRARFQWHYSYIYIYIYICVYIYIYTHGLSRDTVTKYSDPSIRWGP